MSLFVYGRPFERTQENGVFRAFADLAQAEWGESSEPIVLLANATWNDAPIDLAILKRDAIIVADFKGYGGKLALSENGPWHIADNGRSVQVRGGSAPNPLIQIKGYKGKIQGWFAGWPGGLPSGSRPNFGQIAGLVIFERPVDTSSADLPPRVRSWFQVTDLTRAVSTVADIASAEIRLSDTDIEAIVNRLGVKEYRLPGLPVSAPKFTDPRYSDAEVPKRLRHAVSGIREFLTSEERILIVTGAAGTGRDQLANLLPGIFAKADRTCSIHAPSARAATRVRDAQSIYRAIYDKEGPENEAGQQVRPLFENSDPSELYVFFDAHFLSDIAWEADDVKYGSGNLLRDYLQFIGLSAGRKLILIGDPFLYNYGAGNAITRSVIEGASECTACELALEVMEDGTEADSFALLAREIAETIANGESSSPTVENLRGMDLVESLSSEDLRTSLQRALVANANDAKYVALSKSDVWEANLWVREQVFNRHGDLQPGDLVLIEHVPKTVAGPNVESGTFGIVTSAAAAGPYDRPIAQTLSGREEPIELRFCRLRLQIEREDDEIEFICSVNHLQPREHKAIVDEHIALRVWLGRLRKELKAIEDAAKRKELAQLIMTYEDTGRVLFGYALTLRRAQEYRFPRVFSLLPQTKQEEEFNRYAYTVATIAEQRLLLAGVPRPGVWANASWSGDIRRVTDPGWRPNGSPHHAEEDELRKPLRNAVDACLVPFGVSRIATSAFQFEERYVLVRNGDALELQAYFNKRGRFTHLRALKTTSIEFGNEIRSRLLG